MRRFFVEDITEASTSARIDGAEFRHLKKVLRLGKGDQVVLFNGKGLELAGVIASLEKDAVAVEITGGVTDKNIKESRLSITLLQGILKGDKPDFIVQKATELGVTGITFYTGSRTVPVMDAARLRDRLERWRKISMEAAKQCGRSLLPEIGSADFKTAISGHKGALKLVMWEDEASRSIGETLKMEAAPAEVVLLTGPEGGFSIEDINEAQAQGFVPVTLGPRILRAETAALAAITIIQHRLGDMG